MMYLQRVVDVPTGTVDVCVGLLMYLQGQWTYEEGC